jgi:phage major head subunit gpT-like protein
MLVNAANLTGLRTGFSTSFQRGLGTTTSLHTRVATIVPASTKEQKYGWLGKVPNVREWIGPRQVQNLTQHDYAIKEKPFELTLGVDRDDIETDNIGIYAPLFEEMGASTGSHWDMLTFGQLKAGFNTSCYDGQSFFDTDHPVILEDGSVGMVANTDGGAGTSRPLKPIILQKRRDFEFVARDQLTDDNVFNNKEFQYGADARGNVGYGFWQFAWGSKQTLNAANYAIARAALSTMKGDYGRPLGLMPNLLVVPGTLESAARKLLNSEYAAGGETNEWKGTAELLVCPWL